MKPYKRKIIGNDAWLTQDQKMRKRDIQWTTGEPGGIAKALYWAGMATFGFGLVWLVTSLIDVAKNAG